MSDNSLFGKTSSTGAGSLFGSTPSKDDGKKSDFNFGQSSATQPAFGSTASTSTGLSTFSFNATSSSNTQNKLFSFGSNNQTGATTNAASGTTTAATSNAPPSFPNFSTQSSTTPSFGLKTDSKPATGELFGAASGNKTSATSGGLFGAAKPLTETKPATTGTFSFGNKDGAKPSFPFGTTTTTSSETKKEETKSPFSSGAAKPEDKKETPKPTFSFGAKTDSKPLSGGFPSTALKTEDKKQKTTSDKPSFSFSAKAEQKSDENKSETEADKHKKAVTFSESVITRDEMKEVAKTVEPKPISLNNRTLEDLITKWTNQLSNATTSFEKYSRKINEWDHVLVDGGEKISQLYTDVVQAELTQTKIDQSLSYIERQQNELETFLDNYEAKADILLSDVLASSNQQRDSSVITNDQKREQAYRTAEFLDENLSSLGTNLSSLISEINEVSDSFNKANGLGAGKDAGKDDDLSQVVHLLNSHLDSLKWIEKSSDELKTKLDKFKEIET